MGILGYAAIAVLAVMAWFVAVPLAPPLSAPALEHVVRRVEAEMPANIAGMRRIYEQARAWLDERAVADMGWAGPGAPTIRS